MTPTCPFCHIPLVKVRKGLKAKNFIYPLSYPRALFFGFRPRKTKRTWQCPKCGLKYTKAWCRI